MGANETVDKASAHLSADERDRELRKRLRGKPLVPRVKWILGQVAYIAACIAALAVVLRFADGIWLAVGLTVVAFFAGGIFEVVTDFRYKNYRQEWELANGPDLEAEQVSPSS
jgi:fatty acid desaturase